MSHSNNKTRNRVVIGVFLCLLVICMVTWLRLAALPFTDIMNTLETSTHKDEEVIIVHDPQVHFITYSDNKWADAKQRITSEANSTGWFASVTAFGPEDLPTAFAEEYKDVLALPRGGGYWIWKYAIIEHTLMKIEEGDVIVYADSGCTVNPAGRPRMEQYVTMLRESNFDIISFNLGFPEHEWMTQRIFDNFNISENDAIRTSGQYHSTALVLQKGPHLRKWLDMVEGALRNDRWLFTDKYNNEAKQTDPEFRDNRHDQSVASVTRKLVGSMVLQDETGFDSQYPVWATRKHT